MSIKLGDTAPDFRAETTEGAISFHDDEVLGVIDSLQLTAEHEVSTPANWREGDDVIIAGSVSDDEAKEIFGEWVSPKPYIRIVPRPRKRGDAR